MFGRPWTLSKRNKKVLLRQSKRMGVRSLERLEERNLLTLFVLDEFTYVDQASDARIYSTDIRSTGAL